MLTGHGVGLRREHYTHLLEAPSPGVDWFEIISENFFDSGGRPWAVLDRVRSMVPVALHGVSLALGDTGPFRPGYLESLRSLIDRVEPALVSDHLCWGGFDHKVAHDLLPLPWTQEALEHICDRVAQVQENLGRQILIENVSSYVTYVDSSMTEWEFLGEVVRRTGCGLLLDVNNVYVSSRNHSFSAEQYIDAIDPSWVQQIHLAGHTDHGDFVLDSHVGPIPSKVWDLYRYTVTRMGAVPTLIEWDDEIPDYEILLSESTRAREVECHALSVARDGSHESSASSQATPPVRSRNQTLSLSRTQSRFFSLITQPDPVETAAAEMSGDPDAAPIEAWIVTPTSGTASGRLEVYAQMYFHRLLDAARETYPRVVELVGDDSFAELYAEFLVAHPPASASIKYVARGLPTKLDSLDLRADLGDLARLEWARFDLRDERDATPLTLDALSQTPPEALGDVSLRLAPYAALVSLQHDVSTLWTALRDHHAASEVVASPNTVLVWRRAFVVLHRVLTQDEAVVLSLVERGATIGALCEAATRENESLGDASARIFAWIQQWLADEIIERPARFPA